MGNIKKNSLYYSDIAKILDGRSIVLKKLNNLTKYIETTYNYCEQQTQNI